MEEVPVVLSPWKTVAPKVSLMMVALPTVLWSRKFVNPRFWFTILAEPAVLESKNVVPPPKKGLLLFWIEAKPAVLVCRNESAPRIGIDDVGAVSAVAEEPTVRGGGAAKKSQAAIQRLSKGRRRGK